MSAAAVAVATPCLSLIHIFTAGKSYHLGNYVRAELLLAGAVLNIHVYATLVVLKSDELQRYDISSLMKQLIEGMLSIGSR